METRLNCAQLTGLPEVIHALAWTSIHENSGIQSITY